MAQAYTAKKTSHIPKFNGTDFIFWKKQVYIVVQVHKLDLILNGTIECPVQVLDDANAPTLNAEGRPTEEAIILAWHDLDLQAQDLIFSTTETGVRRTLLDCTSSFMMWTRLTQQYEQSAPENKHVLIDRFFRYEYEEGNDVMAHVSKIESFVHQLRDMGTMLDEDQLTTKVLMTLPVKYASFREAWALLPSTEQTREKMIAKLLLAESMYAHRESQEQSGREMALFTAAQRRRPHDNSHSQDLCSFCGLNNHVIANCRKRKRQQGESQNNKRKPRVQCTYCGISNHTVAVCRKRIKNEANKSSDDPSTSVHFAIDDSSNTYAYTAFTRSSLNSLSTWCADSGATTHMTDNRDLFTNFVAVTHTWTVKGIGSDNKRLQVKGYGDIKIRSTHSSTNMHDGILQKVLYVPGLGANLFSIGAATDLGLTAVFCQGNVHLYRNNQLELVGARQNNNLYLMDFVAVCVPTVEQGNLSLSSMSIWHRRFGHAHVNVIRKMAKEGSVTGLNLSNTDLDDFPCKGCALGKSHRQPFPIGRHRAVRVGELIHSDVCGPMSTLSFSGYRYYVQFHDDYSGFRVIYFIKTKDEVFRCFRIFVARLQTETGERLSTFRTDNGGEYVSTAFKEYLEENGIRHETCAPHTPEQDGVSERSNRTIMESSLSSLLDLNLPFDLWAEATSCSVYVQNRIHGRTTKTTPYEAWFSHHRKPDVSHLHVFGISAYVHTPKALRRKLDAKSKLLLFIGYCETQKAWRFFDRVTRRVTISRDAIFCERFPSNGVSISPSSVEPHPVSSFSLQQLTSPKDSDLLPLSSQHSSRPSSDQLPKIISSSLSDQLPSLSHLEVPPILQQPFISEEIDPPSVSLDPALPLLDTTDPDEDFHGFEPVARRSNRIRAQTKSFLATPEFPPTTDISDSDIDDPGNSFTYLEAVSGSDSSFWLTAMQKEMSCLEDNLTWTLTSLPSNHVAIKVRWVYKVKRNIDGSIERRRARLVVKGFTQRPGIDFTETFSPVLKYDSLRVILAIAAVDNLDLFQFDVASAYLQSPLVEELYVEQPPGFCVVGRERDVYRLHKCLYGLRQASRAWNDTFNDFLSAFGLVASEADPCVYLFQSGSETE